MAGMRPEQHRPWMPGLLRWVDLLGRLDQACEKVGITKQCVYKHTQKNPEFKRVYQARMKRARLAHADEINGIKAKLFRAKRLLGEVRGKHGI